MTNNNLIHCAALLTQWMGCRWYRHGGKNIVRDHCWYSLSSLSPSGLCDRCCAFYPLCYAGPNFSAAHPSWLREAQHWKVGEYDANWGTGEMSMRSPSTFLQAKKKKSLMKLELNWSERKTMCWCKCLISTPRLDSMTCLCGRKTHTQDLRSWLAALPL